VTPDLVRRLCWSPPATPPAADADTVAAALTALGARPWQAELAAPLLAEALLAVPAPESPAQEPQDG
jgi:ribonuclease D